MRVNMVGIGIDGGIIRDSVDCFVIPKSDPTIIARYNQPCSGKDQAGAATCEGRKMTWCILSGKV